MLNLIPLPYRVLFGVVLVAGIYSAGYFHGWHGVHDDFVAYRGKVEQAGRNQAQVAKNTEIEHEKNTQNVQHDFIAERTVLYAQLDRLQHAHAVGSPVCAPTLYSLRTPATDRQRSGIGADNELACQRSAFYANALMCELQLKGIREWVSKQGVPISTPSTSP